MKVYSVDIGTLIHDPKNARRHSKKNIESIKNSLTKFGQQKPVVISDKNKIIAGNGTVEAAKELGWKTINVVKSDLDNKHQKAFAIADNRTAEIAEWDADILEQSLAELEIEGFDIIELGFDGSPGFSPDLPDEEHSEMKDKEPTIVIKCRSFEEQQELFDELNSRGFQVKI